MSDPKKEAGAADTGRVAQGKTVPAQVYRPIHRAERGANSTGPSKPV